MTAPAAPLEASDPQRAAALKHKVLDRIKDVRRHLDALEVAMASFGDDFESEVFRRAFESDDPDELNRVKAVERGVDQLYNYMAELAAFGTELAGRRDRHDETNARRDLDMLATLRSSHASEWGASNSCVSFVDSSSMSMRRRPPARSTSRHNHHGRATELLPRIRQVDPGRLRSACLN